MSPNLVVKLTCSHEAPEKAVQALTIAATAVASGIPVSLWLTGEAVWLVVPGKEPILELPHSQPARELFDTIASGGKITACTQCVARRELTQQDLRPGVRIAGAVTFIEEALADGAQALVY